MRAVATNDVIAHIADNHSIQNDGFSTKKVVFTPVVGASLQLVPLYLNKFVTCSTQKNVFDLSSGFKRLSRFLRLGIVEASFTLLSLLKTLQIRNNEERHKMQTCANIRVN